MPNNGEKHQSVESTQTLLKERLKAIPELRHLYSILAEVQTGGRGRSDHTWVSLPGNLHGSILLKELPFSELTWIPLWVSVCVHQALVGLGVEAGRIQLKWPNDLWIEQKKKIGGILCEKIGPSIVVGIGLNLIEGPKVDQETGSVSQIASVFTPELVLEKIIGQMSLATNITRVQEIYEQHALFAEGNLIEWRQESNGQQCSGSVVGLGSYGELLVTSGEKTVSLFAEEVRIRKPITTNRSPLLSE